MGASLRLKFKCLVIKWNTPTLHVFQSELRTFVSYVVFFLQLVLLGESAVGKSSLVLRFVKGQFHEFQESTIGAAFLTQTLCLDDTTVKFEIWDTAGQVKIRLQNWEI